MLLDLTGTAHEELQGLFVQPGWLPRDSRREEGKAGGPRNRNRKVNATNGGRVCTQTSKARSAFLKENWGLQLLASIGPLNVRFDYARRYKIDTFVETVTCSL